MKKNAIASCETWRHAEPLFAAELWRREKLDRWYHFPIRLFTRLWLDFRWWWFWQEWDPAGDMITRNRKNEILQHNLFLGRELPRERWSEADHNLATAEEQLALAALILTNSQAQLRYQHLPWFLTRLITRLWAWKWRLFGYRHHGRWFKLFPPDCIKAAFKTDAKSLSE